MSHVVRIGASRIVVDLDTLERASRAIGCELVRGQRSYRWWGHHVGDFPVPEGFSVEDLGKCDHAVRICGNTTAYEVGVVARDSGWELIYDFIGGGLGLEEVVGKNCEVLLQRYRIEAAMAAMSDHMSESETLEDGSVRLVFWR